MDPLPFLQSGFLNAQATGGFAMSSASHSSSDFSDSGYYQNLSPQLSPTQHSSAYTDSAFSVQYVKKEILDDTTCGGNGLGKEKNEAFGSNYSRRQNRQENSHLMSDQYKHLHHAYSDRRREPGKDRQRKDAHNIIERRRRCKINDQIHELYSLLPQHQEEDYYNQIGSFRLNKGTILTASVRYVKLLKAAPRQQDVQRKLKSCEAEMLEKERRIMELERLMKAHGLRLPEAPNSTTINQIMPQYESPFSEAPDALLDYLPPPAHTMPCDKDLPLPINSILPTAPLAPADGSIDEILSELEKQQDIQQLHFYDHEDLLMQQCLVA